MRNLSENTDIRSFGAVFTELDEKLEEGWEVNCLYVSNCFMERTASGGPLTLSEISMMNHNRCGILPMTKEICEGELISTIFDEAFHVSSSFKSFLQRFRSVCAQAMRTRKRQTKEVFFSKLGYKLTNIVKAQMDRKTLNIKSWKICLLLIGSSIGQLQTGNDIHPIGGKHLLRPYVHQVLFAKRVEMVMM